MRVSTQRPAPASGHDTSKGSARRGSPSGTMGMEKVAVACRTDLAVPCGENALTCGSPDCAPAGPAAKRRRTARVAPLVTRIRSDGSMTAMRPKTGPNPFLEATAGQMLAAVAARFPDRDAIVAA